MLVRACPGTLEAQYGDVAEWLRSGLQSRLHRFDSGRRLWSGLVCLDARGGRR